MREVTSHCDRKRRDYRFWDTLTELSGVKICN